MSTRRLLLVAGTVIVLSFIIVAIAQFAARSEGDDMAADQRPTGQVSESAGRARAALAGRLSIGEDKIEVVSVEDRTWSDTSLGIKEPGMMYAQVLTSGQIVTLRHDGKTYVYHVAGQQAKLKP